MAYCWKTEFEVRDEDGEAVEWYDDWGAAEYHAKQKDGYSVYRIRHYSTEYDEVYPNDETDD